MWSFFASCHLIRSILYSDFDFYEADHGKGYQHEDYGDSDEEYDDGDDEDDDHMNDRKQFPFFTPVTPYPPVYCTY